MAQLTTGGRCVGMFRRVPRCLRRRRLQAGMLERLTLAVVLALGIAFPAPVALGTQDNLAQNQPGQQQIGQDQEPTIVDGAWQKGELVIDLYIEILVHFLHQI